LSTNSQALSINKSLILSTLFCTSILLGQNDHSFYELEKLSKQTGKPILIDFYFNKCQPCVRLKSEVFNNSFLRNRIDSTFLVYFYNRDTETLGLELQHSVKAYPTVVVVDSDKNVLKKIRGYAGPISFMDQLFENNNDASEKENAFYYKIPDKFKNYKDDVAIHRELIEYLLEDENYDSAETNDPLGICGEYFYSASDVDTLYIHLVGNKLLHLKEARKWLLENAEILKDKFGVDYMQDIYQSVLRREIPYPMRVKKLSSIFNREKKIAKLLSEYVDADKEFIDSLYYRNVFFNTMNMDFESNELNDYKEEAFYNSLKFTSLDDKFLRQLIDHALILCIGNACTQQLAKLIRAIDKNEVYSQLPSFLELQAIALYRLKQENDAIKKIIKANDLAYKNNITFKPVISTLKAQGLLLPVSHKCD